MRDDRGQMANIDNGYRPDLGPPFILQLSQIAPPPLGDCSLRRLEGPWPIAGVVCEAYLEICKRCILRSIACFSMK